MMVLGVLLAIGLIIYLSMKNISILIAAPIATMVAVLINQLDFVQVFLGGKEGSFLLPLTNYILKYFWIFLLGSLLANLMEESGATTAIANKIIQIVGTDDPFKILLAIFLISFVLTYGGISLFVAMFAIIPLAKVLFYKADISWHLIQIPLWLGICTVTMTVMPGSPAIQNIIPISYLGTSLTAALVPSLLASAGCIAFGLWYMKFSLKRSAKKGQNFSTFVKEYQEPALAEKDMSFVKSIAPLVVLIVLSFLGSLFGNEFIKTNIIYIALVTAVLLCLLLFRSHLGSLIAVLNKGASGSVQPVFNTAAAVAFGSVIVATQGFAAIQQLIFSLPIPAYVNLSLLTAMMSAITGSSSGSLGIVMPAYSEFYLKQGLDPEMIHRIAAIGSNILTIVPQSGVFITFIGLTKLTPKTGFKESFITVAGGTFIAEVIVVGWALLLG